MSETKHTPGPWINDGYANGGHFVFKDVGDDIQAIAYVESPIHGRDGFTKENAKANAKLIAAAPDMLDALIAISTNKHLNLGDAIYNVRESEGEGWEGDSVKQWSDAVAKIDAAIKKATS